MPRIVTSSARPTTSEAEGHDYRPATPDDWTDPDPTNVQAALDLLAGSGGSVMYSLRIQNPAVGDAFMVGQVPRACTVTKVLGETSHTTTTCTFNVEERAFGSRPATGTDVLTSDLAADFGGETSTTFSNSRIAAEAYLVATVSAVANAPAFVSIGVICE